MPATADHPLTVLVVDDDADTAESLAELLALHGHRTLVALDGLAALRRVEAERPDVVLLDIRMPGLSGYEVAGRIRERWDGRDKHPFVVAVSGCRAAPGRPAGFDLHLVKPVDPALLVGVLERFRRLLAPPTPAAELDRPPGEDDESGDWYTPPTAVLWGY